LGIKLEEGRPTEFLAKIQKFIDIGRCSELASSMSQIISGLIVCAIHENSKISSEALTILLDLIQAMPSFFENSLRSLFEILFDNLTANSDLVSSILKTIQALFHPNLVLDVVINQSPTDDVVHFIYCVCSDSFIDLTNVGLCGKLIEICRSRDSKDAKKILLAIGRQNPEIIQNLEKTALTNEVWDELQTSDAKIPLFQARQVGKWCSEVRAFAEETDGVEWESVRLRLYQEIAEGLCQTNETDTVFGLIRDLFVLKGTVLFNVFLKRLVESRKNRHRKVGDIVSEIFGIIAEGHGRVILIRDLLKLANECELGIKLRAIGEVNDLVKNDLDNVTKCLIPEITKILIEMVNDEDVECRRIAVGGFVCLYQRFGNSELDEYSKQLTRPQVKLIELYRNRK
jgi:hypothetical protein